jgi:hypothetical protein
VHHFDAEVGAKLPFEKMYFRNTYATSKKSKEKISL